MKEFAYTPKGMAMAKMAAKKTGKKMVVKAAKKKNGQEEVISNPIKKVKDK